MIPQEAVERAEAIFDEAFAETLGLFQEAVDAEDWPTVLRYLKEIASVVSRAGVRLASYAGVAARQSLRLE